MHHQKHALYLHLVWATWDRAPLILPTYERDLYRVIQAEARRLGCDVLALDGDVDHSHLVVTLPTNLAISELMQQIKGVSSRLVNSAFQPSTPFRWQAGYGAFTISRLDVEEIVQYVRRQKPHHAEMKLIAEYEEIFTTG